METRYMNRHALCGWKSTEQDRTEHVWIFMKNILA